MKKKKAKSLKYLKDLESPFNSTIEEFSLKPSELEDMLDHFFLDLKGSLQDKRMPKIGITNFGVFSVPPKKVDYHIRNTIRRYRAGKIDKDECDTRIIRLWLIRRRLQAEKRGENTHRKWKKLNIQDEIQRIKDEKVKKGETKKGSQE